MFPLTTSTTTTTTTTTTTNSTHFSSSNSNSNSNPNSISTLLPHHLTQLKQWSQSILLYKEQHQQQQQQNPRIHKPLFLNGLTLFTHYLKTHPHSLLRLLLNSNHNHLAFVTSSSSTTQKREMEENKEALVFENGDGDGLFQWLQLFLQHPWFQFAFLNLYSTSNENDSLNEEKKKSSLLTQETTSFLDLDVMIFHGELRSLPLHPALTSLHTHFQSLETQLKVPSSFGDFLHTARDVQLQFWAWLPWLLDFTHTQGPLFHVTFCTWFWRFLHTHPWSSSWTDHLALTFMSHFVFSTHLRVSRTVYPMVFTCVSNSLLLTLFQDASKSALYVHCLDHWLATESKMAHAAWDLALTPTSWKGSSVTLVKKNEDVEEIHGLGPRFPSEVLARFIHHHLHSLSPLLSSSSSSSSSSWLLRVPPPLLVRVLSIFAGVFVYESLDPEWHLVDMAVAEDHQRYQQQCLQRFFALFADISTLTTREVMSFNPPSSFSHTWSPREDSSSVSFFFHLLNTHEALRALVPSFLCSSFEDVRTWMVKVFQREWHTRSVHATHVEVYRRFHPLKGTEGLFQATFHLVQTTLHYLQRFFVHVHPRLCFPQHMAPLLAWLHVVFESERQAVHPPVEGDTSSSTWSSRWTVDVCETYVTFFSVFYESAYLLGKQPQLSDALFQTFLDMQVQAHVTLHSLLQHFHALLSLLRGHLSSSAPSRPFRIPSLTMLVGPLALWARVKDPSVRDQVFELLFTLVTLIQRQGPGSSSTPDLGQPPIQGTLESVIPTVLKDLVMDPKKVKSEFTPEQRQRLKDLLDPTCWTTMTATTSFTNLNGRETCQPPDHAHPHPPSSTYPPLEKMKNQPVMASPLPPSIHPPLEKIKNLPSNASLQRPPSSSPFMSPTCSPLIFQKKNPTFKPSLPSPEPLLLTTPQRGPQTKPPTVAPFPNASSTLASPFFNMKSHHFHSMPPPPSSHMASLPSPQNPPSSSSSFSSHSSSLHGRFPFSNFISSLPNTPSPPTQMSISSNKFSNIKLKPPVKKEVVLKQDEAHFHQAKQKETMLVESQMKLVQQVDLEVARTKLKTQKKKTVQLIDFPVPFTSSSSTSHPLSKPPHSLDPFSSSSIPLFSPDPQLFLKKVLDWDPPSCTTTHSIKYFQASTFHDTSEITKAPPNHHVTTFPSVKAYFEYFEPLLLIEFFEHLQACCSKELFLPSLSPSASTLHQKEVQDEKNSSSFLGPVPCEVMEMTVTNDFKELKCVTSHPSVKRWCDSDLVCIHLVGAAAAATGTSLSTTHRGEMEEEEERERRGPTHVYYYAHLVSMKYKKLHYELQVQCSLLLHHPLPLPSKIYVSRLTSLVTVLREFSALVQLPSFTLCNEILDPTLHPQPPGKDFNDLLDSHEIQKLQRHHGLTKVQAKAVLTALYQPSGFVLIQGPPGTGKTKTILSLLGLLQSNHKRVLICAPSNAAVDVLTSRGHLQGVKDIDGNVSFPSLVRVGNSESISAGIAEVSLDELIEEDLSNFILKQKVGGHAQKLSELIQEKMNCLQVMDTLKKQLHTSTDLLTIQQLEKKLHQHHLKYSQLLPTIHEYKSKLTEENQHMETMKLQTRARHLQNAKFITCTLSTSGHKSLVTSLPKDAFDIVIIDEAAQCVELSALIPLKFGVKKCIFVGDPNQLPPTVFSLHAKDYFYEKSLFVRIQENREQSVILLDTQYRMHPEISFFPSQIFYDGKLKDGIDASQRTAPWHSDDRFGPFVFLNLSSSQQSTKSKSIVNDMEATAVVYVVDCLAKQFPDVSFVSKISILTPYKEQMYLLKQKFKQRYGKSILESIEISTIDGFQGQEKDIIILSCVRANLHGIGFVADVRRMNVALTRALYSLWIIGNVTALEQNSYWTKLIEHAHSKKVLKTVSSIPKLSSLVPTNVLPVVATSNTKRTNPNTATSLPSSELPQVLPASVSSSSSSTTLKKRPSKNDSSSPKKSLKKHTRHHTK